MDISNAMICYESPLDKHDLCIQSDLLVLRTRHIDIKLMRCTNITFPNPQNEDSFNLWKNKEQSKHAPKSQDTKQIKLLHFLGNAPQLLKVIKWLSFLRLKRLQNSSLRNLENKQNLCESTELQT